MVDVYLAPRLCVDPSFQYSYSMPSVTTGSHFLDVSVMVVSGNTADAQVDSFDTVNACDDAFVAGTAGFTQTVSCSLTTNDSMAFGKLTRIKICRDVTDTAAEPSEILGGLLTYAR